MIRIYSGQSRLDPSVPIVALITGHGTRRSENRKTGPMAQVWILRDDIDPIAAARDGSRDAPICGNCPLRAQLETPRTCYVTLHQAPLSQPPAPPPLTTPGLSRLTPTSGRSILSCGSHPLPEGGPLSDDDTNLYLGDIASALGRIASALEHLVKEGASRPVPAQSRASGSEDEELPFVSWKKLENGTFIAREIPPGAAPGFCRECEQRVFWVRNRKSGKKVMLNESKTSHFDTCPKGKKAAGGASRSEPSDRNDDVPF